MTRPANEMVDRLAKARARASREQRRRISRIIDLGAERLEDGMRMLFGEPRDPNVPWEDLQPDAAFGDRRVDPNAGPLSHGHRRCGTSKIAQLRRILGEEEES